MPAHAPSQIILDVALIIEGTADEELPEAVLGCLQLSRLRMANLPKPPGFQLEQSATDEAPRRAGALVA